MKIKLRNITEEKKKEFIDYLKKHPRVIDLLSIMGNYDLTCVMISKSADELESISTKIRQKNSDIIDDWHSVLILNPYKFEYYDLTQPFEG